MPRSTRRSRAARRGWRTRRATARKRSLAAKKGWRTRRARGQAPERQLNVKYRPGGATKAEFQVSVKGPSGTTKKQAIRAVYTRLKTHRNPKGWKIRITEWKKAGKSFPVTDQTSWQQAGFFGAYESTNVE